MYKTKFTIEVEAESQFGPGSLIPVLWGSFQPPCFNSAKIIACETNYKGFTEQDKGVCPELPYSIKLDLN